MWGVSIPRKSDQASSAEIPICAVDNNSKLAVAE